MTSRDESRKEVTRQTGLLSNRTTKIGTWNVRTMLETGKLFQIQKERTRYNIDILGLCETRWKQIGQKRLLTGELLIYSGHLDDKAKHSEGVALMLSKKAEKALLKWEGHGPRIMTASFTTKKKGIDMNIIYGYSPTNEGDVETKDEFYDQLQAVLNQYPSKHVNILMGDMNAKIGTDNTGVEEIMGKNGLGEASDNGERMKDLCANHGLVIGGSVFQHRRIHKVTWVSPDHRTENQIDHICISKRFRRSMADVRAYRGADVGSDHHLVIGRFKLKLKKMTPHHQNQEKRVKYKVQSLRCTTSQDNFKLTLRNKFQTLGELIEEDLGVEEHWSAIKEIFTTTCKEECGLQERQHKQWISEESIEKIQTRREKKAKVNICRTRQTKAVAQAEYTEANKEVKYSLKADKLNFIDGIAEMAEQAAAIGDIRGIYEATKILCGKYTRQELPVKDKNGKGLRGKEEQLNRWAEHFQELLNRPTPENPPTIPPAEIDLEINCEIPTLEEITDAIERQRNGKAAGPDYIPPEALKADIDTSALMLHQLFIKIWNTEEFPQDWREGHLIKLPKKGDLSQCGNYRGITLLSIPSKIFNRILLQRMKDAIDPNLRDNQAGFRRNRSCTDQIATLRIIVEQSLEWNSPLMINFVDYEKAFDSIDRITLWKILRHYGIPDKLVRLIQKYYEESSCRVIHDGQFTRSFEVKTGVRQGCLLSPLLFLLTIDWIMKATTENKRNGIQWTLWSQLEDLDFADDLALLSHSHQQMQDKTQDLARISQSTGLIIHPGKTKVLKININRDEGIRINDKTIEEVDSFTYLGSIIDSKGGVEADVKTRIGKARGAFRKLQNIWRSGTIRMATKLRLFNTNVKSILLYGSETWKLTKQIAKRLQSFVNGCLRKILKINWPDTIRNEELWQRTGQQQIETEIKRRKWRWIGHTMRKPPTNVTRQSLKWNPQGQRRPGRPRTTWRRDLHADLREMGHSWTEVETLAQDRAGWRAFLGGLYPPG